MVVPTLSLGVYSAFTPFAPAAGAGGDHPAGLYPAGGFLRNIAHKVMMVPKAIPKIRKVVMTPYAAIISGPPRPPKMAPAPNPRTTRPVMRPRLSGHHLMVTARGVT